MRFRIGFIFLLIAAALRGSAFQGVIPIARAESPVNINVDVNVDLKALEETAKEEGGKQWKQIKERLRFASQEVNKWLEDKIGFSFSTVWAFVKAVAAWIKNILLKIAQFIISLFGGE